MIESTLPSHCMLSLNSKHEKTGCLFGKVNLTCVCHASVFHENKVNKDNTAASPSSSPLAGSCPRRRSQSTLPAAVQPPAPKRPGCVAAAARRAALASPQCQHATPALRRAPPGSRLPARQAPRDQPPADTPDPPSPNCTCADSPPAPGPVLRMIRFVKNVLQLKKIFQNCMHTLA